jgi:transposase InsO family protein
MGHVCGRYKAKTLMALSGIKAKQKRKFKTTTMSNHSLPVEPNVLSRNFETDAPDRVYVSDITYIRTFEGWLYLAVVLDLYSRRVVGWSFSHRMDKSLVLNALQMAYWRRKPADGLLFHSDRGSQYCSGSFQMFLKDHNITGSMSRKGNCWDNAVAESFFGTLKTECVAGNVYKSRHDAVADILDYIEMFYNCKRMHSTIGYISPMQFEKIYWTKNKAA